MRGLDGEAKVTERSNDRESGRHLNKTYPFDWFTWLCRRKDGGKVVIGWVRILDNASAYWYAV